MDFESSEIFRQIREWRDQGRGVALATVVRTWGSSPRPAGSHLAVDSSGRFVGSVSGGCVDGVSRTWQYGLNYYAGHEVPACNAGMRPEN